MEPEKSGSMQPTTAQAFDILTEAIRKDKAYAHSWHCSLAVSFRDSLAATKSTRADDVCDKGASRFMMICFGVETSGDMLDSIPTNEKDD